MEIIDLTDDAGLIAQIAEILWAEFRVNWPEAWPTVEEAAAEVRESLAAGRISRVALEDGRALGWIGGIPEYDGNVWEVHPLVVAASAQRRGVGRALLADLEACCADRGGLTLWVGSDDENDMTSLGGADVYPDILATLAAITDRSGHPFRFYQRCGFSLAGLVPDANGWGKPDIFLAKRIRR